MKWLVAKNEDVADTRIVLQDVKDPENVPFEKTLPYFMRKLEFDLNANVTKQIQRGKVTYQVCLLAKNSKDGVRGYYSQQCREIPRSLRSGTTRIDGCFVMVIWTVFLAMRTVF